MTEKMTENKLEDVWKGIINKINPIHKLRIVPLEPGLELDELIAEKVFGYHRFKEDDRHPTRKGTPIDRSEWWDEDGCGPNFVNRFSTDIKAAWVLAEKFKLCVVPWGGGWSATQLGQIYIDGERNLAPTAPHAICLAALFYAGEDDV